MLVVVGGHSRKIGKSSLVEGIIRKFPQGEWTAVKITRRRTAGTQRDDWTFVRETSVTNTDSGRYLRAGARRSYWLRATSEQIPALLPRLRTVIAGSRNAIIESNSILDHIRPDLFLLVVDPAVADWKQTSQRHRDSADAFVIVERETGSHHPGPPTVAKKRFVVHPPDYVSPELEEFLAVKLNLTKKRHFEKRSSE